jgi:toxin ParE1/3/4
MSCYVINILASRALNEIADYFAENSFEAGEQFFRFRLCRKYLLKKVL